MIWILVNEPDKYFDMNPENASSSAPGLCVRTPRKIDGTFSYFDTSLPRICVTPVRMPTPSRMTEAIST